MLIAFAALAAFITALLISSIGASITGAIFLSSIVILVSFRRIADWYVEDTRFPIGPKWVALVAAFYWVSIAVYLVIGWSIISMVIGIFAASKVREVFDDFASRRDQVKELAWPSLDEFARHYASVQPGGFVSREQRDVKTMEDVKAWAGKLEASHHALVKLADQIQKEFNATISDGLKTAQCLLRRELKPYVATLKANGIVISPAEIADIGKKRALVHKIEYPRFITVKKLENFEKRLGRGMGVGGRIATQVATGGNPLAALAIGGAVALGAWAYHDRRISKAKRALEEAQGELKLYATQLEKALTVAAAGAQEAATVVAMYEENVLNLERHKDDLTTLRYYVAEGYALLKIKGIART